MRSEDEAIVFVINMVVIPVLFAGALIFTIKAFEWVMGALM